MAANCLAVHSMGRKAHKELHAGACRSKISIRRSKSKPLRVPPGKIVQAQAMLVQGHSQREIGRTLHISPMTVKKILKGEDFQALINEQQQMIFRKIPAVVDSVIAGAIADPYLGYKLLKNFGVIPERGAGFQIDPKNLTPTTEEDLEARQIRLIAAVIVERYRTFRIPLPADMRAALEKASE